MSALGNNYEDNLEEYEVHGVKVHTLEGKHNRSIGKTLVLASLYGMKGGTFARRINDQEKKKSKKEHKESELNLHDKEWGEQKLADFFKDFPKLKQAIDESIESAKSLGYVEDIAGRRRRLPDVNKKTLTIRYEGEFEDVEERLNKYCSSITNAETSEDVNKIISEAKNYKIFFEEDEGSRMKAERQCFNGRIQGSAATLTKATMIMIDEDPLLRKLDAHMVIQVHDEIILDCPQENAEQVKERLQKIMRNSKYKYQITVPMDSDALIIERWGEDGLSKKLREEYEGNLKAFTKEEAIKLVCDEHMEIPQDSIKRFLENEETVLRF